MCRWRKVHKKTTKSARSRSTRTLSPAPSTCRHSIAYEKRWMEEHRRLLCVAADIRCSGLCVRAMRAVRCACLIWRENRRPLALGQKEYVDKFASSARCGAGARARKLHRPGQQLVHLYPRARTPTPERHSAPRRGADEITRRASSSSRCTAMCSAIAARIAST